MSDASQIKHERRHSSAAGPWKKLPSYGLHKHKWLTQKRPCRKRKLRYGHKSVAICYDSRMGQRNQSASSGNNVILIQNLSKTFGTFKAVEGVNFTVSSGEVFGFLGPNGAGKSTTIRMILDVLRPTEGTVTLFGKDSRSGPAVRRRLGYLSGDMVMDSNLTGRQYLEFAAAQYGKDCHQNMTVLAERLQANLEVRIGNYSRGNRQKIGLIAAMQHEPDLLILDEPTSGFDPLVQEEFSKLTREFKAAGGTVFMSSHILGEVRQLCDRIAFIKDGKLINVTAVSDLTAHSAKRVRVKAPPAQLTELRRKVGSLRGARLGTAVEDYALEFSYQGEAKPLVQLLVGYDIQDLTIKEPELDEIFMHYYEPAGDTQA